MFARTLTLLALVISVGATASDQGQPARLSDRDIIDAYHYFLGRLLILRQEHLDLKEGLRWNAVTHRAAGSTAPANPNLDVALSEAWIAVDNGSCTILELPVIKKRYYTVQVVNGWGETVANLNERNYPQHPSGPFALCLRGASVSLPKGALRVDLPGKKSRVLAYVELGADPAGAVELQKWIRIYPTGNVKVEPAVEISLFSNDQLPRIEAFNRVDAILAAEPDINPGMEPLQAKASAIAKAAREVEELKRIDEVILKQAIPRLQKASAKLTTSRNGWTRPSRAGNYGGDYLSRTIANLTGVWANSAREAVIFKSNIDSSGRRLNGSSVYTMTFPKGQLPASLARYLWSVMAVDSVKLQVIDNTHKVYQLDNQAKLYMPKDGSLTLYFAAKLPDGVPLQNWLPTPAGRNYNLMFRFYGPRESVQTGAYFPPPLVKKN